MGQQKVNTDNKTHMLFNDRHGKFHSVFKRWSFEKCESVLKRIGATYWEIGI